MLPSGPWYLWLPAYLSGGSVPPPLALPGMPWPDLPSLEEWDSSPLRSASELSSGETQLDPHHCQRFENHTDVVELGVEVAR